MLAKGMFEVKLEPQASAPSLVKTGLGRMTIDKVYEGDLVAHSLGEMLAFRTATDGSAGYVALERVSGNLHGRHGSFVLQHDGSMERGHAGLSVRVVPDSGTEELAGLRGSMTIEIEGGQHFYAFEYTVS
ncbi:DUF3224 domain-containing protein [Dyella sp. A6]|uniref:DUF3224 domain-containing protein n=1 Tax=Dyella aluminiiresistens TaxID=3069105 RepID=UPI002E76D987|nr:DUF3224 domain-containing protein [Dyella sp. A6]